MDFYFSEKLIRISPSNPVCNIDVTLRQTDSKRNPLLVDSYRLEPISKTNK
ncbi:hypothetical protein LEP1GSC188_0336 [Leptospira weilii serovar Topaz str. LT2116]|uniref:Uncharacterized protein n=1 Tax=Leptospira weilii serovar Topaz str. LT2116 TaxID=1088540 RepID=M3H1M1_9LEPT|nr:hypothetical protein LEP1GSC188_0336 [Leptospira weilii serovar Topaz str. LT2116]